MSLLEPCFTSNPPDLCEQAPLSREIQDILSFHRYLRECEPQRTPFATLVVRGWSWTLISHSLPTRIRKQVLHNLVTSTVPPIYWREGVTRSTRRYFCVNEAVDLLSPELKDITAIGYPVVPNLYPGIVLPGISPNHRLVSCP